MLVLSPLFELADDDDASLEAAEEPVLDDWLAAASAASFAALSWAI